MIIYVGIAVVFAVLAAFFLVKLNRGKSLENNGKGGIKEEKVEEQKINYGRIRIYYGSQTGTAAKLAEQLGQQFKEHQFQPEVIDLKHAKYHHFSSINEISVFLLSNTGQGDAPENAVKWMKVMNGLQEIEQNCNINWKLLNYTVFGLGNTQYEHFNKTGIDVDKILQSNGANRIYKLGLGDDNCSLEDDYTGWKSDLWSTLKEFRSKNPIKDVHHEPVQRKISAQQIQTEAIFLSNKDIDPMYANFRLFLTFTQQTYLFNEQQLDFKTKNSLNSQIGKVVSNRQLRQNINDGSTIQVQIQLQQSKQYQTAGNIAIYGKNDPEIVKEVLEYFQIKESYLNRVIDLKIINEQKKLKINFIPRTLRKLLEQSIDLQGKLTKSLLKKLSKFQSQNQQYFVENSAKTTDEFKRITEEHQGKWYYLIKIIKEHKVKLSFEDFIELSDSMAPRLFTIASYYPKQQNVVINVSITENGLFSKYVLAKPLSFKAELKKSTFTDAMKWKKVIFLAAGTGLAPFRAYLQQKQYLRSNNTQQRLPIVTLFFGCKHQNGDFIYKDQILAWQKKEIINRLHLAFSRDQQHKLYVQDLLKRQQAQLQQFGHCQQTALYFCGSFPMGQSILEVLRGAFGAQKLKEMEQKGKIVKQLW